MYSNQSSLSLCNFFFSAQQDYGKEKKARDERIKKILETIKDFEATRNTKGQDLDQYRRAILKSREDIQQLKWVQWTLL